MAMHIVEVLHRHHLYTSLAVQTCAGLDHVDVDHVVHCLDGSSSPAVLSRPSRGRALWEKWRCGLVVERCGADGEETIPRGYVQFLRDDRS